MKRRFSKLLLPYAFAFLCYNASAQTVSRSDDYFKGSTSVKSFTLGSQAVLVSSENDKQVKIIASSMAMKKNWEQTLQGSLLYAGSMSDKILVMVSTDFSGMTGGDNSTYKAFTINALNGKVIAEKIIHNGNNDYVTIPEVVVSKDQKTFTLFARETSYKRNVKVAPGVLGVIVLSKKLTKDANKIRSFSVSTFDSNLEIQDKVFPVLPAGEFVGAAKTINNDLYVAVSTDKKGITIAKYDSGKEKASSTILEPFSHSKGIFGTDLLNDYVTLFADTIRNNTVYLKGAFKNDDEFICLFNKYDFATNNHKRFTKSFKKADFKALEKAYTPLNKTFKSLDLGNTTDVEVLAVVPTENNYLLALGDIHTVRNTSSTGSYTSNAYAAAGIIVYSMDNNLEVKSVATIPRGYYHSIKPDIKIHYKNDFWNLFATDGNKANFIISKINAASGKVEDIKLIEPEKAGKTDLPGLEQMIISEKQLLLPVKDYKLAFGKVKFDVNLYQINW
jgi:hypothetical protein